MTEDEATRLYNELGVLPANTPNLNKPELAEVQIWLGRVHAILEEALGIDYDVISFRTSVDLLSQMTVNSSNAKTIMTVIHRTMAKLERRMPAQGANSFIGTGEPFSALTSLQKVIGGAKVSLLFVDPYSAANLLRDFAILAAEGVKVEVLAANGRVSADFLPALRAWQRQYGSQRPIELRLAPKKSLHDRAIFVDDTSARTVGTSFNGIGKSAPTILQRVDPKEVLPDKLAAYRDIWASATVAN